MRCIAACIAASLLLLPVLCAQQYVFRAYRQTDGLKDMAVRSIAADCQGFLWIGTENGVFRFLGSSFVHYGPEQGITEFGIQEVVTDPACNVWVGTTHNLYRLDGQRFQPAAQTPIHVLSTHGVAVEDEHNLLVVDDGRLYRLKHDAGGHIRAYQQLFPAGWGAVPPEMGPVTSVSVIHDAGGNLRIWIGAGNRLYSWVDNLQTPKPPPAGAVSMWGTSQGVPHDAWQSAVLAGDGTLWVQGWTHLIALPGGARRFVGHNVPLSAQGGYFLRSRLIVDPQGRVLAPTEEGVARWERDHWHFIDRNSGLPRNYPVSSMFVDRLGGLWLGTYGDGLYDWAGYAQWEGWSTSQHLPSPILWAVDPSRPDRMLAGTDKGPAWINPRTGASGSLVHGKLWSPGLIVAMGPERDGAEWIATNSGSVLRLDPYTGVLRHIAHLPASIVSGFTNAEGGLFLGTDHGIYMRAPGAAGVPRRVTAANAFVPDGVKVNAGCQAPNGVDWFLAGNRLVREDHSQWSRPLVDGLPGETTGRLVAMSCAADGSLWVTGERVGAWRIAASDGRLLASSLRPPAELGGDAYAILADRRGWVWLGTDQGLLVWNGRAWRQLTQESGMIWNDVDEWGLAEGPDGSIWVGTGSGLAHLLHPDEVFSPLTLPIALTSAVRGGDSAGLASGNLALPWSPLPLRLQLASPVVRNRSQLVFRYQLAGQHSGWIENQDGLAVLSGLSPGSYTFLAMAANPALHADSDIIRLHLVIRPPWWRNPWFFAVCGLILLLLLAVAARTYARHLRARSSQLEALVRERTRELEESREQLRIQATHDGLTGMLNRAAILRKLSSELDRSRSEQKTLILALADVDHFKSINDLCGHLAGDEALRCFAAALRAAIRPYDHAGRYGGEEFLLILSEVPPEMAESRLCQLHAAVTNLQVRIRERELLVTCSIGATLYDSASGTPEIERLLAVADQALYAAKAAGRNCVLFRTVESSSATA